MGVRPGESAASGRVAARRALSGVDPRALAGSALLWSWVDNLYMSSFFRPFGVMGEMPELATWVTFALIVPLGAVMLLVPRLMDRFVASRAALIACGAAGTAGAALFMLSARTGGVAALLAGAALSALFMSGAVLGWGAVYCSRGARSAVPYVAGGFACALVPDLTFMAMSGVLGALGCATLPLLSCALLATQDLGACLGGAAMKEPESTPGGVSPTAPRGLAGRVRGGLGIGLPAACSIALVMFGLGYMQHNISFSPSMSLGGPMVDVARAVASLAILAFWAVAPRAARNVYRVGLLLVVAGFSLMPFLYQTPWLWVCGAVNIVGYAAFDVLVWVIVAQAAHAGLARTLPLVCSIRLLVSSLFSAGGGLCAVAITRLGGAVPFAFGEAVFVGYLMTVAIVLIVGDRDVWDLIDSPQQAGRTGAPGADPAAVAVRRLGSLWGLTAREREVFALLALGRTQPWVAERLGISESTVNSHVRHIYAKAGVNSRQDLLDLVIQAQSPEPIDRADQAR